MEKYSWHQSHDQATVLVLLNGNVETTEQDVRVKIESQYLVVQIGAQPATVKGRLYGDLVPSSSTWHLEHTRSRRRHTRPRHRTASSTSSNSSYTFLSDPGSTNSAAVSPPSEPDYTLPDDHFLSPAFSSPNDSNDDEPSASFDTTIRRRHLAAPGISTPSSVGGGPSLTSSVDSTSLASFPTSPRSRLLTIHLDKKDPAIWPSLIIGGVPIDVDPPFALPPQSVDEQEMFDPEKYNMDATSLSLVGVDLLVLREDRHQAFEYLLRAWLQGQIPLATLKLVSTYIPLQTPFPLPRPASSRSQGTTAYYVRRVGGTSGVARLFLDAGLLHLEGAAAFLLSSTSSGLSSLRTQGPFLEYGRDGARDKATAMRYFDRAQSLDPELPLPNDNTLIIEGAELRMPSMDMAWASADTMSTVSGSSRRTRSDRPPSPRQSVPDVQVASPTTPRMKTSQRRAKYLDDDDEMSYLYLPGLVGAGTALLAVGLVGVMSVSWWRKGQA